MLYQFHRLRGFIHILLFYFILHIIIILYFIILSDKIATQIFK